MQQKASLAVFLLVLVLLGLLFPFISNAMDPTSAAWAHPTAKTVKRIGAVSDIPEQPNFMNNLNCNTLTFRKSGDSVMQAGCFMSTAFGLLDPDSQTVIMNGTDEAVDLKSFSSGEFIVPWQSSGSALALDSISTGGMQLSLYKAVYESLRTNRSISGSVVSKQFTHPPDSVLRLPDGSALIGNPQTLAFSDNGYWLVVESYRGVFVRINLATLDVTAFAQSFAASGSPALLKSNVTISNNGQYVAIENSASNSFTVYDLDGCTATLTTAATSPCAHFDYKPFITSALGSINNIRHVRFINDSLLIFDAATQNESSKFGLAPSSNLPALSDYLGLGDSYSSGEGAFDYLYGTDTDSNMCHLSVNSYPVLIGTNLYGTASSHSVACSGAVINDIVPNDTQKYRGQVKGGRPYADLSKSYIAQVEADYTPGVLGQIDFATWLQPKHITVSVGGNDIGFGHIITTCVSPHLGTTTSVNNCYSTQQDRQELLTRIDKTIPRWVHAFEKIKASTPQTHIYVIGYPSIAAEQGNCGLNVLVSQSEIQFVNQLVRYLNARIATAAQQAKLPFIDIEHALDGHRLCETSGNLIAVNGLTAGKDSGLKQLKFLARESYHPNALGHTLIAKAILQHTHNFESVDTQQQIISPDILGSAPSINRQTYDYVPSGLLESEVIASGSVKTIALNGAEYGITPNTPYQIRLGDPAAQPMSSGNAMPNGDIVSTFVIPQEGPKGAVQLHVTTTPTGNDKPVDMRSTIYIPHNSFDYDNDSILNDNDSCPYGTNSGQDADIDGIDDACDGTIEQSTSHNTPAQFSAANAQYTQSNTSNTPGASNSSGSNHPCSDCRSVLGARDTLITKLYRAKIRKISPVSWALLPVLTVFILIVLAHVVGRACKLWTKILRDGYGN